MKQKTSIIVYKLEHGKARFLVARRPESKIWQYPTATCEENEDYLDCAFREIKEELGEVTILNFTDLNQSFFFKSTTGEYEEHIVAFEIKEVVELQKCEFDKYEFLPLEDASKKVFFKTHRDNLFLVSEFIKKDKLTKFFIFVAPTACGKSVIIKSLLNEHSQYFERVKTYMTRPFMRAEDELLRVHVSKKEFADLDKRGLLIEKNLHDTNWYGSSFQLIEQSLKSGKHLIAEIDINGLKELKKQFHNITSIFICAPLDEIEFRLRERGGHSEKEIQKRLEIARKEIAQKSYCDHVVVNRQGKLDITLERITKLIVSKLNLKKN